MPRTFVDRGGTFTDRVVFHDDGQVTIDKTPSDRAVVGALAEGALCFGTTVATNALLERDLAPTLLLVTEGFADLPRLRHMARPELFDPDASWPEPLATRVVEVTGRVSAQGDEITPLRLPALDLDGITSVAIVLLHAPQNPAHERTLAEHIREHHPELHLALGHEIDPEVGYLARIETTLVDAAVTPKLRASMRRDRIPGEALAMRSDGGLCRASTLRAPDAVLSGPAGGVLAVADIARRAGLAGAVGLDMGGTSTDVCVVQGADLPRHPEGATVAGVQVRRDMVEVETIAAGGGSILRADGIFLTAGPESAGADPGPQCYGRGGPPTVTDAALAAGLVNPDAFDPPLRPDAVQLPGRAEDFLAVAHEAMAGAVRRIAASRGIDVRDFALVAYGGAAGQHAASVAARLGIDTVLFHPCAGVLSAWGQALAPEVQTRVVALWCPLDDAGWAALTRARDPLLRELGEEAAMRVELRIAGTDTAVDVGLRSADTPASLTSRFHARHEELLGFARPSADLEIVNLRARREVPAPPVPSLDADPWGVGDATIAGPNRIDCDTTSIHIPQGWRACRHEGLLRLQRDRDAQAHPPAHAELTRTPVGVSLWSSRFMAAATAAGEQLRRLARSVSIRERRDFSVAIFDTDGQLVANAPHIPVHLGAMGETVRDVIAHESRPSDGDAWLTNDPAAGGSHLPDLTVITAVVHDGLTFWVASRGHHVDVGGLTPGSMPPDSKRLSDEGVVFRRLPLLRGGRVHASLDEALSGSRQPQIVRADLEAQLAANRLAARRLRELGSAEVLAAWMGHLQDAADEAVADLLTGDALGSGEGSAEDTLDGFRLAVHLRCEAGRLQVDFTGTEGPHPRNLNAPRGVVRAAVLYALRVLSGAALPLNEGALRRVDLILPNPSVLSPPEGAAVVGGNVETSQRVVDLLLRAFNARAASQGTMNNLTLGGDGWSLYETLGGGQGATPTANGVSGLQVHMTNTRATDPEVMEHRLPLRLWRFALRCGSGGAGQHRGGDGVIREIEALVPATASLLAGRRSAGAAPLGGGEPGEAGEDALYLAGDWLPWSGETTALSPGDKVRVCTPGGGGWGP